MLTEFKKIEIKTVIKCFSVVFFLMGLVIGVVSFIYALFTQSLTVGGMFVGVLAIILYALIFSLVSLTASVLLSLFYNVVVSKMGGVKIVIETTKEKDEF